jgi:hypothetical protein
MLYTKVLRSYIYFLIIVISCKFDSNTTQEFSMKEISSMDFPQHGEVFYFYGQALYSSIPGVFEYWAFTAHTEWITIELFPPSGDNFIWGCCNLAVFYFTSK